MKILRLWILSTAWSLLFPAIAAAQVTGMTVTPAKPTVGFPATITVTGKNPCGAVEINYGALAAGDPPTFITHAITALPYSVKQTWTSVGPRHLTAKGQGHCTGQASIDITVAGFGRPAQPQTPTITGVIGMSTPGGIIAITGHHFRYRFCHRANAPDVEARPVRLDQSVLPVTQTPQTATPETRV